MCQQYATSFGPSIYITTTSPRLQLAATVCKPEKIKQLRYAGSANSCNARKRLKAPLQGGGRWFEPSIAHSEKRRRIRLSKRNLQDCPILGSGLDLTIEESARLLLVVRHDARRDRPSGISIQDHDYRDPSHAAWRPARGTILAPLGGLYTILHPTYRDFPSHVVG